LGNAILMGDVRKDPDMGDLFLLFEERLEDLGRTADEGAVGWALDMETTGGDERDLHGISLAFLTGTLWVFQEAWVMFPKPSGLLAFGLRFKNAWYCPINIGECAAEGQLAENQEKIRRKGTWGRLSG
jgi:hypothetical protein